MSQLQQNNIFTRTWFDLQTNPNNDLRFRMSLGRLKFEACKLTIQSIVNVLDSVQAWDIQQADLQDYSYALLDIHQCFREFSNAPVGTQYPFSKLISPLNQATQYLGVALGQKNIFAKKRTESIQNFREWLDRILEQIKGLGELPP